MMITAVFEILKVFIRGHIVGGGGGGNGHRHIQGSQLPLKHIL